MTFDVANIKVTEGQKSLAAYIKRETGKVVKPESIALVDALRVEYRKDPERVAERDAIAAAARAKQEAALEKALAKAQALAKKLGLPLVETAAEPEQVQSEPEPEVVVPITRAKSSRKTAPIAVVEDVLPVVADDFEDDDDDFPEDVAEEPVTVEVMESDDGWAAETDDDDVEDF